MVPRLRTCTSPMEPASAASAGIASLTLRRLRDRRVPRHGPDPHGVAASLDPGQRVNPVKVNQVGAGGEAEAHRR